MKPTLVESAEEYRLCSPQHAANGVQPKRRPGTSHHPTSYTHQTFAQKFWFSLAFHTGDCHSKYLRQPNSTITTG